MLTIRMSRIGKRKKPIYRLIISEKTKDPYGRALEIFGTYNPFTKELNVKGDRINYWLSVGAGMSATVNNLLLEKGIIKGDKVKASKPGKKKKDEKDKKETKKEEKSAQPKEKNEKKEEPKPEEDAKQEKEKVKEDKKD